MGAIHRVLSAAAEVGSPDFGRVFYDGFESGNGQWIQDDYRNMGTIVSTALDSGSPHSGSSMLRANWDGTLAWNDPANYETQLLPSWAYSTEFLIRLWVRADADVDTQFGSKWLRLYSSGAVNSFILDGQMEQAGGPIYTNIEVVDGVTTNLVNYGGTQLGNGSWHKIEIYVKQGLANAAILRVWVDDTLEHEETGFSSNPSNKWYPLYLMSNWSNNGPEWDHDANNHIYWDDVEIYSDQGTGGTGAMSDGTAGVA